MSREVEVLRQVRTVTRGVAQAVWERIGDDAPPQEEIESALSAAISALEEKEARTETWGDTVIVGRDGAPAGLSPTTAPSKPSSDSMEERFPEPVDLMEALKRSLYPHKSWCRGDHSEWACISDPSEVDHG
jgi:hypothetical protein